MRFDVVGFLNDQGISYHTAGENISHGWVATKECPFCRNNNYHFGINLSGGGTFCWVCGHKGWIYEYISLVMGLTETEVKRIGKPYFTLEDVPTRKRKMFIPGKSLEFPKTFMNLLPTFVQYLESRNFDISTAQRYDLKCADITDIQWKFRIIIPFYIQECLVGWTARTLFDDIEPRYKNINNDIALCNVRDIVYNIDNLKRKAILVEGPTDVWRLGDSTAAMIGLQYTNAQIAAIKAKGVEEATVIFDGEEKAYKRALSLAKNLDFIGVTSSVIRLEEGQDPGNLTESDAAELRHLCL